MEIHLAIAFDQNYFTQFNALLASIFENNKENIIILHCIATGLPNEKIAQINRKVENAKAQIIYYKIDETVVKKFVLANNWTAAVYYRLFFPHLISDEIERLLYIDTDTLVVGNLKPLFNIDISPCPVGAVYDNYVKTAPQLGINEEGKYFNSGVLLIDVKKWRQLKISERCFEYLDQYPERIKFVDQDALNAVLTNNWKPIDHKFNFLFSYIPEGIGKKELDELVQNVVIIHYTIERPWNLLCRNRLRNRYFRYLKISLGFNGKKITDFRWSKLPAFIRLRMVELYFDYPLLKKIRVLLRH